MASTFLQKRFAAMLKARAGATTVQYLPFDSSAVDTATGDVEESTAYGGNTTRLPALIETNPSQALRQKVGLEIDFEAMITLAQQHLTEAGITVSLGDAFVLPLSERRYYVTKIMPIMQAGSEFIGRDVAVGRKVGRR